MILGIPLSQFTMDQTTNYIDNNINEKTLHHCVIIAGKVVLMKNDKKLLMMWFVDLINPDGMQLFTLLNF